MKRKKVRSQALQFVIREDIYDKLDEEKNSHKIASVNLFVKEILIEMDLSEVTLNDIIKIRFEKDRREKEEGAV